MADSAMANWNAVCIVYDSGSANVKMENRERTCLLHWSTSLHRHTQKYIKEALQHQHITLCKQYKDSKSMDQAEVRYLAIRSWWLSSGAVVEEALHHLDHWLAFWHFRYHQWGGFMDMVCDCLLCIIQFKFRSSFSITMLRVFETSRMSSPSARNVGMFSCPVSKVRGPSNSAVTCVGSNTCFGGVVRTHFFSGKRMRNWFLVI